MVEQSTPGGPPSAGSSDARPARSGGGGDPTGPSTHVRPYRDGDYAACRSLWVELTEHHRTIYGDPTIGGADPGAAFDEYLGIGSRLGSWVAADGDAVVGLTGMLDRGESAEIEPVVVTVSRRGGGLGRQLVDAMVTEAASRGFSWVAIRPVARNTVAIRRFYEAGFRTLGGHVDLTLDLQARRHGWIEGTRVHDLDFRY